MEQTEFGSFIDCNQRGDCCHSMWRRHNRGIVYRWGLGGAPFRDQCMCAVRKRKNNIDYAEAVRQGADGRAALEC